MTLLEPMAPTHCDRQANFFLSDTANCCDRLLIWNYLQFQYPLKSSLLEYLFALPKSNSRLTTPYHRASAAEDKRYAKLNRALSIGDGDVDKSNDSNCTSRRIGSVLSSLIIVSTAINPIATAIDNN